MKGIILAGGKGTRLRPATLVVNKHMVPLLNRPMITFPLETLKTLGVTDIMIISGGGHVGDFAEFLGDGSDFGVNLTYRVQKEAGGIAQALSLAEDFVGDEECLVILGDNIFENIMLGGVDLSKPGAVIFTTQVDDPERFGVVSYHRDGRVKRITEKPKQPDTRNAVIGLYKYPSSVFDVIKTLKPSGRGELEITDVNNHYVETGELEAIDFRGFWSDAGTPSSLFEATEWVHENMGI